MQSTTKEVATPQVAIQIDRGIDRGKGLIESIKIHQKAGTQLEIVCRFAKGKCLVDLFQCLVRLIEFGLQFGQMGIRGRFVWMSRDPLLTFECGAFHLPVRGEAE